MYISIFFSWPDYVHTFISLFIPFLFCSMFQFTIPYLKYTISNFHCVPWNLKKFEFLILAHTKSFNRQYEWAVCSNNKYKERKSKTNFWICCCVHIYMWDDSIQRYTCVCFVLTLYTHNAAQQWNICIHLQRKLWDEGLFCKYWGDFLFSFNGFIHCCHRWEWNDWRLENIVYRECVEHRKCWIEEL